MGHTHACWLTAATHSKSRQHKQATATGDRAGRRGAEAAYSQRGLPGTLGPAFARCKRKRVYSSATSPRQRMQPGQCLKQTRGNIKGCIDVGGGEG